MSSAVVVSGLRAARSSLEKREHRQLRKLCSCLQVTFVVYVDRIMDHGLSTITSERSKRHVRLDLFAGEQILQQVERSLGNVPRATRVRDGGLLTDTASVTVGHSNFGRTCPFFCMSILGKE